MGSQAADHLSAVETWAPIPDVSGYEVSDHGRFRSIDRIVVRRDGITQERVGRNLRIQTQSAGYQTIRLLGRHRYVHQLVLRAFVGPPPEGMECCHINGNRGDNRLTNLRWGTKSDNAQDTLRHGTHPCASRTHCPRRHPLVEPNLVPGQLRRGHRSCLACARAHARVRYVQKRTGVELDVAPLAEAYFAEITKGH